MITKKQRKSFSPVIILFSIFVLGACLGCGEANNPDGIEENESKYETDCYDQHDSCLWDCDSDIDCQIDCEESYSNCLDSGDGGNGTNEYCELADFYHKKCTECIEYYGSRDEIPIGAECYCARADLYDDWCVTGGP